MPMSEAVQEVVSTQPPVIPAEVVTDQTAEQAPAETPPAETKAETTDAQPEKHGQSRFERRISKLYRKLGEADARAAALEKELEGLKTPRKAPEGAPKLEQFDDIEKYADAKAEWVKSQTVKEIEEKERTRARQSEDTKIVESWESQVEAVSEKYDDFSESLSSMQPNTPLTRAIMSAENGAEVAYHLDKNPKALKRILELPAFAQVLAIGKLSAKLESEPPVAKQPSKAPPPIAPVSGKTAAPADTLTGDEDMKTFIKIRNRQLGRK